MGYTGQEKKSFSKENQLLRNGNAPIGHLLLILILIAMFQPLFMLSRQIGLT